MIATSDLGSQSNGYTHVPMEAIRIYNPNVVVSVFFSIIPKLPQWVQHKSSAMRMSSSGLSHEDLCAKKRATLCVTASFSEQKPGSRGQDFL